MKRNGNAQEGDFYRYLKSIRTLSDDNPEFREKLRRRLRSQAPEVRPGRAALKKPLFHFSPLAPAAFGVTMATAAAALFVFLLLSPPLDNSAEGMFTALTGGVKIRHEGVFTEPELFGAVSPGDVLRLAPDATAEFQIGGLLLARIDGEAEFVIERIAVTDSMLDGKFRLERGLGLFHLVGTRSGGRFVVTTPQAVFRATGTVFLLQTGDAGTTVSVGEGTVEVLAPGAENAAVEARVNAGEEAFVAASTAGPVLAEQRLSVHGELISSFGARALLKKKADTGELHRITATVEPAAAVLTVNDGVTGRGKIAFLAETGTAYRIEAKADGYQMIRVESIARQDAAHVLTLEPLGRMRSERKKEDETPREKTVRPIPRASISIDGTDDDWKSVPRLADDPVGDGEAGAAGTDLVSFSLARDDRRLYLLIRMSTGFGDPGQAVGLEYVFELSTAQTAVMRLVVFRSGASWSVRREETATSRRTILFGGTAAGGEGFLETSLPLEAFDTVIPAGTAVGAKVSVYVVKSADDRVCVDETDQVYIQF